MDKKEYLSRYHNLIERIERKKQYIAFCEEQSHSIPGQDFSVERVDHTPSFEAPFVKWIIRGLDAERELKDLEAKASAVKVEIESSIVKLDDDKLQFLLVYRYINWLTWEEIQDRLFISQTTRKRWHDKALELLQVGP